MKASSTYPAFVEELDGFHRFLDETGLRGFSRRERSDPDVERLLEAIAYFSAQTRLVARRAIHDEFQNLFHSYLDFLLQPLPAVGLVEAIPGELDDPTAIPVGAEIDVRASNVSTGPVGAFRTTATVDLFPLAKEGRSRTDPETGEFVLRLRGSVAPRILSLFVHRTDFPSAVTLHESLLLHTELERRLPGISVVYVKGNERSEPQPLVRENGERAFDFGLRRSASDRLSIDRGPALAQVRRLFHFPEEWLYLNLEIPPYPAGWTHLELRFASWPDAPRMSATDFHLHVVPVENVQRAPARPIEHRGLVSRYPILHPEAGGGFELLSLRGVYRNTPEGRVPLRSHLLRGEEDHYSLESGDGGDERPHIAIHAVDAFEEPLRVSIDALWHQPDFQLPAGSDLTVETPGRDAARVQWRPHGALRAHAESPLREEGSELAQLLWLKMKPVLDCEGLLMLLRALGSFEQSVFHPMAKQIQDLKAIPTPSSDVHTVIAYRYRLLLGDYSEADRALAYRLSQQIWNLISHWTADGLIELRVDAANGDQWVLPSPAAEGPGHWETLG